MSEIVENKNDIIEDTIIATEENDSRVIINTQVSIEEMQDFIEKVKFDACLRTGKPSYFDADVAFFTYFIEMFTNFETSYKDISDFTMLSEMRRLLMEIEFVGYLRECVDKELEMMATSNEAIETVSYLANRTLDGINKFCDVLDDVKDMTKDGKFLKAIPKKKLDHVFDRIQGIINDVITKMTHSDSGTTNTANTTDTTDANNNIINFTK